VSRRQLTRLGLTPAAIRHRLDTGRLTPIYRGVYAVGHTALSDHGRVRAALLAAGPTAIASHRTAAALYGLIPSMPAVLEVTVTDRRRRSRPDLVIHTTTDQPRPRILHSLPLTAPFRTLADLAATRPNNEVERAVEAALVKRLVTQDQAERLVSGAPTAPTRSELERRMLRLIADAGLSRPHVNHPVGPYVVDFLWPERRVIVETDGYASHGHRAAFERDRARDAALYAAGYTVLRFTWRQITREPLRVAALLAQAAAAASPSASNSSTYGWPVAAATGW
jgi:very-short-patch-repair endonuclease